MEQLSDLYEVLGITRHATEEDIKASYRKLAKKYHPDAHPGDRECEKRFQAISEAYSILGNPEKKKKYDMDFGESKSNAKTAEKAGQKSRQTEPTETDFENIHKTFERFFGFNPNTGNVTNEQKLNPKQKNPIDTTDMFERFMGLKR